MDNFKVIKGRKHKYVAFQIENFCFVTFKKDMIFQIWNFELFSDYFRKFAGDFYVVDLSVLSLPKFIKKCVRARLI